mmetsp:Transcript_16870/g.20013  ORF Transcript_16870/g.20013 Transcript_16870/m.20013 type:complete len:86 (-) Transcript_16870:1899-2156(-)
MSEGQQKNEGRSILRNHNQQRERSAGNHSREASPSFFDKLIHKVKDEFLKDGRSKNCNRIGTGRIPRNSTFTLSNGGGSPLKRQF